MPKFAIVEAPSILGLRPSGVENLPQALKQAGLHNRLNARFAGHVPTLPYDPKRDPTTHLLNGPAIHTFSLELAPYVTDVLQRGEFPIVLGGDCSILIGNMLALRRSGRYGLFFIDGHADFYQPEASPTGEVADMDLGIVTGRGPDMIANIDGLRPLVRDEDVVVFGYRDGEEVEQDGSRDVRETKMHVFDLAKVREMGIFEAASAGLRNLLKPEIRGFWIHLDADVLDDAIMPAVDYRMPGGLNDVELTTLLKALLHSGQAVGIGITIFNPSLDPDGLIGQRFAEGLIAGLINPPT